MTLDKAYSSVNNRIMEKAQEYFPNYSKDDLRSYQVESPAAMEKILQNNGVVKTSDGYFLSKEKLDAVAHSELEHRISVRAPVEIQEARDSKHIEMMSNELADNIETAIDIEDPAQAAELLRNISEKTEQLQNYYENSSLRVDDASYQDIADELDSIRKELNELAEEIERDGIDYNKEDTAARLQQRIGNLGTPERISEKAAYGYDER